MSTLDDLLDEYYAARHSKDVVRLQAAVATIQARMVVGGVHDWSSAGSPTYCTRCGVTWSYKFSLEPCP